MRFKKMSATVVAVVTAACLAGSVFAAGLPSPQPVPVPGKPSTETEAKPGGKPSGTNSGSKPGGNSGSNTEQPHYDMNVRDHKDSEVISVVDGKTVTVVKAKALKTTSVGRVVCVRVARNADGKRTDVTEFGNGKKGVFNSKSGRLVNRVDFKSAKRTSILKSAFYRSNVARIRVYGKVWFRKDAFKGTRKKNVEFRIYLKKASGMKVDSGAFRGLNSKSKMIVTKMSASEFKKFRKAMKKAGFKGEIVRKTASKKK